MVEKAVLQEELSLQRHLRKLVDLVVEEEGFSVEKLPTKFEQYYFLTDSSSGRRCVDGRKPRETYSNGSVIKFTEYADNLYNGSQFAGGSNGELGALMVVTELKEGVAKSVIFKACQNNNVRLGNHNDDNHGEIKDKIALGDRKNGCGKEDKQAEGKLLMYKNIETGEDVKESRIQWIKKNDGLYPALTGSHNESKDGAGINFKKRTTFNTKQAVDEENSIFNLDVREMYEFAPQIYEELSENIKKEMSMKDFRDEMVKAVVKDYLQTLGALGGPNVVWIRGDLS